MVRVMTHWFPLATRGKTMGWLGTCYQLGAAASLGLATFLTGSRVARGGDWRLVFLVPSFLFAAVGLLFVLLLRNQPEDVGLPPVHASGGQDESDHVAADATPERTSVLANVRRTLSNPTLWCVALTFFMLDLNCYGFMNWMPDYLAKSATPESSLRIAELKTMMKLCIDSLSGALGVVCAGWATDRSSVAERAPVVATSSSSLLGVASWAFSAIDPANTVPVVAVVALAGFCTYGPHILMVGHAAQDFRKEERCRGRSRLHRCGRLCRCKPRRMGRRTTHQVLGVRVHVSRVRLCSLRGGVLHLDVASAGPLIGASHPAGGGRLPPRF